MADSQANPVLSGLKFPAGADNRSREYEIAPNAARSLINLDVTRGGGLRCRAGLRLCASGSFHSLFAPGHGAFVLAWRDGHLVRMDRGGALVNLVVLPDLPVVFGELDGTVYWSNGISTGRVGADGVASFWGLPVPPRIRATPAVSGGLSAGTYQVSQAAIVGGVESGAPDPVSVEVPEGGGIDVVVPTGATFAVYRTPPNGASHELALAAVLASGTGTQIGAGLLGRRLQSWNAAPPRAGRILAAYRGRLWIADGSTLWFTSERSPHWVFEERSYFQVHARITALGATGDGLYVATADDLYFLVGSDPDAMTLMRANGNGTHGLATRIPPDLFVSGAPPSDKSVWVDSRGFVVVGTPGGQSVLPAQARHSASGVATAAGYREENGLRQVLFVLDDGGGNGIAAGDS